MPTNTAIAMLLGTVLIPVSSFAFPSTDDLGRGGGPTLDATPGAWLQGNLGTHDGTPTRYDLWKPNNYQGSAASPYPMVVILHGNGGNAMAAADITDFTNIANGTGGEAPGEFLAMFPEQVDGVWDFGETESTRDRPDMLAVLALIDHARTQQPSIHVGPDRIYLTGYSGGGHYTAIMAALYPDKFAAAAPALAYEYLHAANGADPDATSFEAAKQLDKLPGTPDAADRIPIISFHGLLDPVIGHVHSRVIGQQFTNLADAMDDVSGGRLTCVVNGNPACNNSIDSAWENCKTGGSPLNGWRRFYYTENAASTAVLVERWIIAGMHHQWSGSSSTDELRAPFTYPQGPNQSDEIWKFFKNGRTLPSGLSDCVEYP